MKKAIIIVLAIALHTVAVSQDSFVRGIFMFGDVKANFGWLRDSLHLNWVQGEVDRFGPDENILENDGNLKVAGISYQGPNIYKKSEGQRIVIEAEAGSESSEISSYFSKHPDSVGQLYEVTNTEWVSSLGTHKPGYMVMEPMPDNEYRYSQTDYTARYALRRGTLPSGNPAVAELEVWCKVDTSMLAADTIYYDDLATSLTTIGIPFSLPDSGCRDEDDQYRIDIRLKWLGAVTLWLDKVIVEDDTGHALFSGAFDTAIRSTALDFKTSYPLLHRFNLRDEPYISAFLTYNYIQNQIRDAYATDTVGGKGSGFTAVNHQWERFVLDAGPHELVVDSYPITANIPTPTMSDAEATDVGIAEFDNDPSYYTFLLQNTIQSSYIATLSTVSQVAFSSSKDLWVVPQLHGEYFENNGKFVLPSDPSKLRLRPPTGNEIKMMCNLAVVYGAKGIFPFIFETTYALWTTDDGIAWFDGVVSTDSTGGVYMNHFDDYAEYDYSGDKKAVHVNYPDKWNALAQVMSLYERDSIILSQLRWKGAKSWYDETTSGPWSGAGLVTQVQTDVEDEDIWVETGHFTYGGDDYYFIVNRRTLEDETRTITLTFNNGSSWQIEDADSGDIWIIPTNGTFSDTFAPGEGKLFKASTSTSWSGSISVTGDVMIMEGATLTIAPSTSLSMQSGKQMKAYGTLELGNGSSGTITLGGNEVFVAKAGGEVVIREDVTLMNVWRLATESGGLLSVEDGSTTKFTSATNVYNEGAPKGAIWINGSIQADGATLTSNSTDGAYFWGAIYIVNSDPEEDANYVRNCSISKCKFGLAINNSVFSDFGEELYNNHFDHCLNPIRLTYGATVTNLVGNRLEDNLEDGIVIFSSTVSRAEGNVIQKNATSKSGRDGFWIYGSGVQPLLVGNHISDGSQDGIRCQYYASPNLGGPDETEGMPGNDTIMYNTRYGVNAPSSTVPFLGDYDYASDCAIYGGSNQISDNSNKQLYVATAYQYVNAEWNYWGTDPDYDVWDFTTSTKQTLFGNTYPKVRPAQYEDGREEEERLAFEDPDVFSAGVGPASRRPESLDESIPEQLVLLVLADQLVLNRNFELALAIYDSLVRSYPETNEAVAAMPRIYNAMLKLNARMKKEVIENSQLNLTAYFDKVRKYDRGTRLEKPSLELGAAGAVAQRDYDVAISRYKEVISKWPGGESEMSAKAALFDLYLKTNSTSQALKTLEELNAQFPKDPVTEIVNSVARMNALFDDGSSGAELAKSLKLSQKTPEKSALRESAAEDAEEDAVVELGMFPNPFNPVTNITYTLPDPTHVELVVFDLLGRRVAILVNEEQDPGIRQVAFDGSHHPSGVYYVRLTAGAVTKVGRLLLVK